MTFGPMAVGQLHAARATPVQNRSRASVASISGNPRAEVTRGDRRARHWCAGSPPRGAKLADARGHQKYQE